MLTSSKVLCCDSFLQFNSQLLNFTADFFVAVRLQRFVMRQYVFLCLAIHHFNIVLSEANGVDPVAAGVDELNLCGSSLRATRDQHRHQAYG